MARTKGHGNAKWSRDETILALALYFELGGRIPPVHDQRVVRLSQTLRAFPRQARDRQNSSFRNAASVVFKLQNLRQVCSGHGLTHTSSTDRQVCEELASRPVAVKALARLIETEVSAAQEESPDFSDDDEFLEGRLLTNAHRRRERNGALRKRLLQVRRQIGQLVCEMCLRGSDISNVMLNDAQFEVHHLLPISAGGSRFTKLSHVSLLCANCHRILHRAISTERRWLTIEDARRLLTP